MKNFELAKFLFHQGTNFKSYDYLGVTLKKSKGKYEYYFRTWAPNAQSVGLIGDFISWSEPVYLERITEKGLYELRFLSDVSLEGRLYKFVIESERGRINKGDPYARLSKGGDDGASVICCEEEFAFTDSLWMKARKKGARKNGGEYLSRPINIYELHLGSFLRHGDGSYFGYEEIADKLISYVKAMGYTHVEFLPLAEYPYDGSWGYQVGAFYAPTSRFGRPEELKRLVDRLHNAGIGVIMDWVGAHFPKDEWGLFEFDGKPLYEYQGRDRQESDSWGTRFFDLGREEVQSFLISNALYFLREFHFDGLRIDAVASMIYLDFDRRAGEWIPNTDGTNENKEGVAFLKKLNSAVFKEFPDALMIAEESGSFSGITGPTYSGGLGFNLKWNMGFANDLYDYLSTDPFFRKYKHDALTFPIMYAHKENYCLPISHDEVVHGKKSFIDKCFGNYEDKFKTARLALLLIMTYPGKKLLFMGSEFGQFREWDYDSSLEWFMLDYPSHRHFRDYVSSLNHFYLSSPELYELDFSPSGFEWISCDESEKSSVSFKRYSIKGDSLGVAVNFSGSEQRLTVPCRVQGSLTVVFDTGNIPEELKRVCAFEGGGEYRAQIILPPLSGMIFKENDDYLIIKKKGDCDVL